MTATTVVATNDGGVNFPRRRVAIAGWVSRNASTLMSLLAVRVNFHLRDEGQFAVPQVPIVTLGCLASSSLGPGPALKNLTVGCGTRREPDGLFRRTAASLIGIMFVAGTPAGALAAYRRVSDTRLAARTVVQAGFDLLSAEPLQPYHAVALARKPPSGVGAVLLPEELRRVLRASPFGTDRKDL